MSTKKFEFSGKGAELLEQLSKEEGVSEAEILQKALSTYRYIKKDVFSKGKKLGVLDADKKIESVIKE